MESYKFLFQDNIDKVYNVKYFCYIDTFDKFIKILVILFQCLYFKSNRATFILI